MYPHERSLVKQLENKPFALIGVNSDRDREKLKDVLKEKELTWRSFWNGGSTRGPISTKWNVRGWPTTYLIDAKGVIRYKNIRGAKVDRAVEELMKEMDLEVSIMDHVEFEKQQEEAAKADEDEDKTEAEEDDK